MCVAFIYAYMYISTSIYTYLYIYLYIYIYTYILHIYNHIYDGYMSGDSKNSQGPPKNGTLPRSLHQRRAAQLRPRVEIRPVGDQQLSHAEVTSALRRPPGGWLQWPPKRWKNPWKIYGKWMENGWNLNLPMGIFRVTWSFTFRIAFSFVRLR